jgi:hypothetical protein
MKIKTLPLVGTASKHGKENELFKLILSKPGANPNTIDQVSEERDNIVLFYFSSFIFLFLFFCMFYSFYLSLEPLNNNNNNTRHEQSFLIVVCFFLLKTTHMFRRGILH